MLKIINADGYRRKELTCDVYEVCDDKWLIGTLKNYKQYKQYMYFQEDTGFALTASQLREIADKLDELNTERSE